MKFNHIISPGPDDLDDGFARLSVKLAQNLQCWPSFGYTHWIYIAEAVILIYGYFCVQKLTYGAGYMHHPLLFCFIDLVYTVMGSQAFGHQEVDYEPSLCIQLLEILFFIFLFVIYFLFLWLLSLVSVWLSYYSHYHSKILNSERNKPVLANSWNTVNIWAVILKDFDDDDNWKILEPVVRKKLFLEQKIKWKMCLEST